MAVVLTNNAVSRLASSLTSGATTLSVTTGDGNKFPALSAGQWFPVTLIKSTGALEIVRCTARSGDVLTVTRGQESTSAQSFAAGDRVELRLTAAAFSDLQTLIGETLRKDDNLASLTDKAASRTNLGLKTGAETDKQTSSTDTTAGRLLIVGAHGVGAGVTATGTTNLNSSVVGSIVEVNGISSDASTYNWPALVAADGAVSTDPVRWEVETYGSATYTVQKASFMLATPAKVKGRRYVRVRINGTWQSWAPEFYEGIYGIGRTPSLLTNSDNLNSVVTFGCYQWAAGSLPTNIPTNLDASGASITSAYLDVVENNGATIIQTVTDKATYQQYRRTSASGSSWSAWEKIGGKRECSAWVNFNGSGVVAIRDSFNVSSITDNGTGNYLVNFTTAMENSNYSTTATGRRSSAGNALIATLKTGGTYSTSAVEVDFRGASDAALDADIANVVIFGGRL